MEKNLTQSATEIIRVAFVGPECTGKTTLSQLLAQHFQTTWVAEYMRTYLQKKWDETKSLCTWDDLLPIALGQISSENEQLTKANRYLFCDTNLLELVIYSYIYYGKCMPEIEKYALENQYDIVFLTYIDVPWQADDLRDRPNQRAFMFDKFRQMLDKYQKPYTILKGNLQERKEKVLDVLNKHNQL